MDTIRSYLANSAKTYYEYLTQNDKGVSRIKVRSISIIQQNKINLSLDSELSDISFLKALIADGKKLSLDACEISLISPMIISLEAEIALINRLMDAKGIYLIIDFRILVKRIQEKYEESAETLKLPNNPPALKFPLKTFGQVPFTVSQQEAINNIFASPISYIWGGAGSGKTRFVLAYSILAYLLSKRRVLLCAPTNIALENALKEIIPIAVSYGIAPSQIYRHGKPSADFTAKYPESCNNAISKELKNAQSTKTRLERLLRAEQKLQWLFELNEIIDSAITLSSEIKRKTALIDAISIKQNLNLQAILSKETAIAILNGKINAQKRSLQFKIKSFFNKKHYTQILSPMLNELGKLNSEHIDLTEEKHSLTKESEVIKKDILHILRQLQDIHNKIKHRASNLKINVNLLKLDILQIRIHKRIHYGKDYIGKEKIALAPLNLLTTEDIKRNIEQTDKLIADLTARHEEKNKAILLHGCTLDGLVSISDDYIFSHAFLDEACYSCIAKTSLLFFLKCPVTYLGDHMQLPPVSEINDIEKLGRNEGELLCLWEQSGIYSSSIFEKNFSKIYDDYINGTESLPGMLSISVLPETHRFGKTLSYILNKYVYKNGFTSIKENETFISVIHASKKTPCKDYRENIDEVNAIKNYLNKNHTINDFAILTPYVKQAKLLKNSLSKEYTQNILTVHKSQGQEWDTVILSVSDTSNKFFTDVNNPSSRGKQLLNTAISRARKNLIIVCDTDYWAGINNQLISELIRISIPTQTKGGPQWQEKDS